MGVCVFARSDDPVYYLAVRAWVGAPAHFEDAASGAANATLAAWLASRDALPGDTGFYRVSQGREVGHDAIIELQVTMPARCGRAAAPAPSCEGRSTGPEEPALSSRP